MHLTVNHSLHFKDPETGVHSNTIECSWRHAKASMSNYCRKKEFYAGYLAKYMFTKKCRLLKLDPTAEFFKYAGTIYNDENHMSIESNSDNDDNHNSGSSTEYDSDDDDAPGYALF